MKAFYNKWFYVLKDNIALQGFYFSFDGFLVCYGITILFVYKVLSIAMFKGFKVVSVSWCGVRQNNRVSVCSSVGGVIHKVIKGLWMV